MSVNRFVLAIALSPSITAVGAAQKIQHIPSAQALVVSPLLPDAPSTTKFAQPENHEASGTPNDSHTNNTAHRSLIVGTIKRGVRDQAEIYSAPFHLKAVKWDIGVGAVTAGLIATDPDASRKFEDTSHTASLRISDVGLYGTIGTAGMFYLSGAFNDNAHTKETGLLGMEAIANAAVTYTVLKTATGRERPLVGAGNGRFWHYNRLGSSFPSGHSTMTWAGASVIAHEYPKRWVQILAYGTATAVAFARYSGRQHFPSDVFVGSVVGYFIGQHIFNAHCSEGLSSSCHQ